MGYVYARRGQVDVEYSLDPFLTPGPPEWNSVGCVAGDISVPRNKSPGSTELDNWCVTQEGVVQQVELGALVIEPVITVEMDLADDAYDDLNTAFNSGATIGLRFTATDADGNTHVLTYAGVITNHDLNFRGAPGATSQFTFTFHVNEVISDVITPAA